MHESMSTNCGLFDDDRNEIIFEIKKQFSFAKINNADYYAGN